MLGTDWQGNRSHGRDEGKSEEVITHLYLAVIRPHLEHCVLFGGLKTRNCTVIHLINMSDPPEDHGSGCTWSSSPGSSRNGVRRQCQRYGSLIKGGEQMIHCEHSWRSEWIAQRSCEISNPDAFLDLNSKVWFKFNQHWHPYWVGAGWEISCGPFLPVWFPVYIPTMYPGLRLQPGDKLHFYMTGF